MRHGYYCKGIVLIGLFLHFIHEVNSVNCLNCKNIADLSDCRNLLTCPDNQVCYIERFLAPDTFVPLYNTGCKSLDLCTLQLCNKQAFGDGNSKRKRQSGSAEGLTVCSECCYNDTCNTQGCGYTPQNKGIAQCYKCTGVYEGGPPCLTTVDCDLRIYECSVTLNLDTNHAKAYDLDCVYKRAQCDIIFNADREKKDENVRCCNKPLCNSNPYHTRIDKVSIARNFSCPTDIARPTTTPLPTTTTKPTTKPPIPSSTSATTPTTHIAPSPPHPPTKPTTLQTTAPPKPNTTITLPTAKTTAVPPPTKSTVTSSTTTATAAPSKSNATAAPSSTSTAAPPTTSTALPTTSSSTIKSTPAPPSANSTTVSSTIKTTVTSPTTTASTRITSTSQAPSTTISTTKLTQPPTLITKLTTVTTTSTTTTPKLTIAAVQTTPPVTRSCAVCSGPPFLCEKLYASTPCKPPNNYCINTINNHKDGSKTVVRKCGDFNTCNLDWFQGTSDNDKCKKFTGIDEQHLNFQCTFCCVKDDCNVALHPAEDTLYKPD